MKTRSLFSWAAIGIAAGLAAFALGGQRTSGSSPAQPRPSVSAKEDGLATYQAKIRRGRFTAATLYYDTVDREGLFDPDDIIASHFSETCSLSGSDVARLVGSLGLLKPVPDREAATDYVNMALVFQDTEGIRRPVYFFYSIDGGKVNAMSGGAPFRTSSDFPQFVVRVARQRCGPYWPFPREL